MQETIFSQNPQPINDLALKKASEISAIKNILFDALMHNPEDRSFADIIADYITFTTEEMSAMREAYPSLPIDNSQVHRMLACEVLMRSKNERLSEQAIRTYLYAYTGERLRFLEFHIKTWKLDFNSVVLDHYLETFDGVVDNRIIPHLTGHNLLSAIQDKVVVPIRKEFYAWLMAFIK